MCFTFLWRVEERKEGGGGGAGTEYPPQRILSKANLYLVAVSVLRFKFSFRERTIFQSSFIKEKLDWKGD